MVVAINHAHVEVHEVCINLNFSAFVNLRAKRVSYFRRRIIGKYDRTGTHQPRLRRRRRFRRRRLLRRGGGSSGATRTSVLRLRLSRIRDSEQPARQQEKEDEES